MGEHLSENAQFYMIDSTRRPRAHQGDAGVCFRLHCGAARRWQNLGIYCGRTPPSCGFVGDYLCITTLAGHARIDEVLALVMDYAAVLRGEGGISEQVWEENRALAELRFNFTERLQPFSAATALAHAMHDYSARCGAT